MNMFEDDYKLLSAMDGVTGKKSDTTLKEYQSFTDLRFSKNKVITQIEWHPVIKGDLLVSSKLCAYSRTSIIRTPLSTPPKSRQSG